MASGPPDGAATASLPERVTQIVGLLLRSGEPVLPRHVVAVAVVALPHGEHTALTLRRGDRPPVSLAASDGLPRTVDALEHQTGEGPRLDVAAGPGVTVSADVGADARWPLSGPRCVRETGMHSILRIHLPVGNDHRAALTSYARAIGAFSAADAATASALVPLAALAVEAHLRRVDHDDLMLALRSSRRISTAVGVLAQNRRLSSEDAMRALRRASTDLDTRLHDVADEVLRTGELPTAPVRRSPAPSGRRRRGA